MNDGGSGAGTGNAEPRPLPPAGTDRSGSAGGMLRKAWAWFVDRIGFLTG